MNVRTLSLAIRLLSTAVAGAALVSIEGCGGNPWQDAEEIDLGTSADLLAIARVGTGTNSEQIETAVAVGGEGTVVIHDLFGGPTTVASVGDVTLRDVLADLESSWWIVGDGGYAAVSADAGATWTPVDVGTSSDLHAIARLGSQLVIISDDVVLVQAGDGSWSEAVAPTGGWGQLRDIHSEGARLVAVGLGGKIVSTEDAELTWTVEASGTSRDLLAISAQYSDSYAETRQFVAVGGKGTVLLRNADGTWKRHKNRLDVDLIAIDEGSLLGAGGELYSMGNPRKIEQIDTLPGARALVSTFDGMFAIGDAGVAYDKRLSPRPIARLRPDTEPHITAPSEVQP